MTRNIVLVVLCLAVALVTVHAQSNYAVVRGSILDPQHRPIAGARVHVTAKGTGAEREVVSGATGLYEIAGLQPGAYMLAVDSPGFKQATQAIDLEVGQQATLDLQLSLGPATQTVVVQASEELLKTQDASVGEVVDQRSVDSLPLNGRMLIDLILTVPGARAGRRVISLLAEAAFERRLSLVPPEICTPGALLRSISGSIGLALRRSGNGTRDQASSPIAVD